MNILIIGKGFIARRCKDFWPEATIVEDKIYEVADAVQLLEKYTPAVVLNAAGIVGKPNVDWCEDHQLETVVGNVHMPIALAQACAAKGIYMLHVASGCVFYGPSPDLKGWLEYDHANPSAVYSRTKYAADLALSVLPNVGIARIRMPLDSIPYAGNLIDKLASYSTVVDVENSVTIIEDMVHVFKELLQKRAAGIFHVTNPGIIKHKEILELYTELVDPTHTNEWVTAEELVKRGLAKKVRSNNVLQSPRLQELDIHMRPVTEALRDTIEKYARNKSEILIPND